ncbi:tetratricopeptide repeat-containing sensor histidine kinase [Aquimarina agarivorans]|uniref:tetratricopeptide repeat-containing sensor histidine kinase n=1 Tax=Aquimarina agarivorans TaxID=980584 RepID=UPI000248F25E|nr:ATP-binding protein [Aquimarina agarivorans]
MKCFLANLVFFVLTFLSDVTFGQANVNSEGLAKLKQQEDTERKQVRKAHHLFYELNDKEAAYKLSHQLLKKLKTDGSKSRLTHLISCYFLELKMTSDSALYYSQKTLNYSNFSNDSVKQMRNLMGNMSLASTYLNKGLYENAKRVAIEGQESAGKWNFEEEHDRFILYLADIYSYEGKFDKSIALFLKIINSIDIDVAVGSMMSLGRIYNQMGEYKKSILYYDKALKINENPYYDLAISFYSIKNLPFIGAQDKVIQKLEAVVKRGEEMKISHLKNQAKKELIDKFLMKNQFKEADHILLPLLEERKKQGNLIEMLFCYDKLKESAKKRNSYSQALKYSEAFLEIRDSISEIQKEKEIDELEVRFETLQKEKENEQLKKDKEKQVYIKNLILAISVILFISIMLLVVGYSQKLKTQNKLITIEKQAANQKINALMREQDLKLVKAKIEGQDRERKKLAQGLHDSIGSDIATIKLLIGEIKTTGIAKIQDQMNQTYKKIREMSHNTIPVDNRHNDFIEILKEYFQNIDDATNLNISVEVFKKEVFNQIETSIQNEIFAIQKELITNTLKHAEAKNVTILLEYISGSIHLTYEDDGKGFSEEVLQTHKGIGIKNIKNRVDQLSGVLIIDSHPKRGTLFKIEVKVILDEKVALV